MTRLSKAELSAQGGDGGRRFSFVRAITGLASGLHVLSELRAEFGRRVEENQALYLDNVAKEAEFLELPFAEVLQRWGITNEQELNLVCRGKFLELLLGVFLALFALGGFWLVQGTGFIVYFLHLACLSMAAYGLILSLTAWWRLDCLRKRRFLPLRLWLWRGR